MPTCPLCESTQSLGDSCDVCGRPFPAAEARAVPIPTLPELESTRYGGPADVPISRMAELEPTSERGAEIAPKIELVDGFSPTSAEWVSAGAAPLDLEPLEVERAGEDAALDPPIDPGPPTCRYCRAPARPGERLCAICGMRLPLVRPVSAAADGG
ncbi:MAG TPA: hypothetical protein VFK85_07890, partial [Anaeromyxobacteraceae bacterium]|nr:hypothetical protein [Anaeromyxobacteraceae bacterium]